MMGQDRRIATAFRRLETIGEPQPDVARGAVGHVGGNPPAPVQHQRPQVVQPVGLVGMLMREHNRVE